MTSKVRHDRPPLLPLSFPFRTIIPGIAALDREAASSAKRAEPGSVVEPVAARAAPKLSAVGHPVPKSRISRPVPRARGQARPTTAARAAKVSGIKVKMPRVANQSIVAKATDRVSTCIECAAAS